MKKIGALLFTLLITALEAKEIISLLKGIENNHTLHMQYKQQAFVCKPFGIETVSELAERTDINSSCAKHLSSFRQAYPKEKFFAAYSLHVQQQYSVEGIDNLCLLYLSSEHSYSEALLEQGYARIPPGINYKDPVLHYRFKRAVQRAKNAKAGIWSDTNVRNCFLTADQKR